MKNQFVRIMSIVSITALLTGVLLFSHIPQALSADTGCLDNEPDCETPTPTPPSITDPYLGLMVSCLPDLRAQFTIRNLGGDMQSGGSYTLYDPNTGITTTYDLNLGAGQTISFIAAGNAIVNVYYTTSVLSVSLSVTGSCIAAPTPTPTPTETPTPEAQTETPILTPTPTPTPTTVPTNNNNNGGGDGLSDGRNDGHSSCPECTQAPKSNSQVLGATTDFAKTGTAQDILMNIIGAMGGVSTAAGVVLAVRKRIV